MYVTYTSNLMRTSVREISVFNVGLDDPERKKNFVKFVSTPLPPANGMTFDYKMFLDDENNNVY